MKYQFSLSGDECFFKNSCNVRPGKPNLEKLRQKKKKKDVKKNIVFWPAGYAPFHCTYVMNLTIKITCHRVSICSEFILHTTCAFLDLGRERGDILSNFFDSYSKMLAE